MISGFAMVVAIIQLFVFGCGVGFVFFLLNRFFPPFKKLVNILVNADK